MWRPHLSEGTQKMHTAPINDAPILEYLRRHGQHLDSEIATATGISLQKVRASLSDLKSRGEISQCSVTRFNDDKPFEGFLCRVAGSIPPSAPGRKPGAKPAAKD
jgi:hypothetical protein